MGETKHTAGAGGPWTLEVNFAGAHLIKDSTGTFVCECAGMHAPLILAAPDTRAALENAFSAMGRAGANADINHPLRGAWEDARAAISKALGN